MNVVDMLGEETSPLRAVGIGGVSPPFDISLKISVSKYQCCRATSEMVKHCFLAIDLSTTACKALIFNSAGELVGEAYRDVPLFHPRPDWVEADARDWWRLTVECIRESLRKSSIAPSRVAGVGVCGLMHALLPVDRSGEPLDRVMLWMDQRCKPQCEWIANNIVESPRIVVRRPSTTVSAPKLRWMVENKPEIIDRTYKFMFGKDYVKLKLTGQYATDLSDAGGTALLDRNKGDWSSEMLRLIGVPEDKMLPIRDSTEIAGYVTQNAAEETGLNPGTPVVIGASDVRGTYIGVNMYVPGRTCLYMGTAAWMVTCPEEGTTNWMGSTATWGAGLRWYREMFDDPRSYPALDEAAWKISPGADGVIFFPHLMGERGPKHNPHAKGVIFGLTLAHRREHVVRAILEGNAYLIRHIIDRYGSDRIGDIVAAGGGAKSKLWRQIIADVTHKTVLVPRVAETTALGAAMLAAVGTGDFATLEEAAEQWVQLLDGCTPENQLTGKYDEMYDLYRRLDASLEPFYSEMPVREGPG
jgi:xylulokinase